MSVLQRGLESLLVRAQLQCGARAAPLHLPFTPPGHIHTLPGQIQALSQCIRKNPPVSLLLVLQRELERTLVRVQLQHGARAALFRLPSHTHTLVTSKLCLSKFVRSPPVRTRVSPPAVPHHPPATSDVGLQLDV